MELKEIMFLIEKYLPQAKLKANKMKKDYELYKGNAEIFNRTLPINSDFTKNINHDFVGYIVDQSVGYLFGNPIAYLVDDDSFTNEFAYKKFTTEFKGFRNRINVEDLDAETGKMMGICGYGARLLYIDEEGYENTVNLLPYECEFFIGTEYEGKIAFRFYEQEVYKNGVLKTIHRVDFFDDTFIYHFESTAGNKITPYYCITSGEQQEFTRNHFYAYLPLIEYANNKERMNDFDKVKQKINAYDESTSDLQSEIEQFRLSILAIFGFDLDDDQRKQFKKTGIITGIPENGKIEYIVKNINDTFIQNQLKNLKTDIFLFANAVNFTDENFSGNSSGVALEYKLLALENKCIQKERKFSAANRTFLKTYFSSLRHRVKMEFDPYCIDWKFNRNLPIDYVYQADILQKLKGFVSEDTRLSSSELIRDVETEKRKIKEDEEAAIGLDFDLHENN